MITSIDKLDNEDSAFINCDCMDGMRMFPDNYFDLAIVDPPYGGGFTEGGGCKGWFTKYHQSDTEKVTWDTAPTDEYFKELFRISRNQVVWGGNYFQLPPTKCFLVWRKLSISESFTMAMAEYAWTSFTSNAKVFECAPQDKTRFHPTQKPVKLYEWILNNYAEKGDVILDTHVGSASSLIACHETGHRFVGFEINKDYYVKARARLEMEMSQMTLYDFLED